MTGRYKMMKTLKVALLLIIVLATFSSCRDDIFYIDDEVPRQDNLMVEIVAGIEQLATRAPQFAKIEFQPEDVIHIQGVFTLPDGYTITKYGAFKYDGSVWGQYYGSTPEASTMTERFSWPNNAVKADFKAYYISSSNSLLVPTDDLTDIPTTSLSELNGTSVRDTDKDPLQAELKDVKYGHTIYFNFVHACSYLTVEDIPGGYSSVFWFTQETDGEVSPEFKNAFRMYLTLDKELKFEFVQKPDRDYNDKVYVEGTVKTGYVDGLEKSNASFFLAPGQYLNFVVGYPGSTEMVNFITYTKKQYPAAPGGGNQPGDGGDSGSDDSGEGAGDGGSIDGDIEGGTGEESSANPDNILLPNGVYTFSVERSSGIIFKVENQGNLFDESDDPIYDVDAGRFLWAVCNNEEYIYETENGPVVILQPNGTVSKLMKHVNMQWAKYTIFPPADYNNNKWFEPSLGQGVTFDGGGKYIWNLGSPLFRTVDGEIRNLGLANAEIDVVTMDEYIPEIEDSGNSDDPDYVPPVYDGKPIDISRQGALCGFLNNGTIRTISVKTHVPENNPGGQYKDVFTVNAKVLAYDSQEAHNVGCLIGSNLNGTVNNIILNCNMNLNVTNYDEMSKVPKLSVGGIIGQNVNNIYEIGPGTLIETPTITITNTCNYRNANYYIGGMAGSNTGRIEYVTLPKITINSVNSLGFICYLGGLVGDMSDATVGGYLLDCNINEGTVTAGKTESNGEAPGGSYTGGISGQVNQSYTVEGCTVNVSVIGPFNRGAYPDMVVDDGTVTYGTGGMFGLISPSVGKIGYMRYLLSNGQRLIGPKEYIGYFAGIVPEGVTWTGNYADKDIDCKTFNYPAGGGAMPAIGSEPVPDPTPDPTPDPNPDPNPDPDVQP